MYEKCVYYTSMVISTHGYLGEVGPLSAARPMSCTLEPSGPRRDFMVLEHSYHLNVWKLSATQVGATSRILYPWYGLGLSLRRLVRKLGLKGVNLKPQSYMGYV